MMLLMVAWRSSECHLPDEDEKLARWARVDRRTWLRIKPTVMGFWILRDGFWTQKRLSSERDIVSKRADVARSKASMVADLSRWKTTTRTTHRVHRG